MSTFLAITFSGVALGAVYFLIASGLSLIYGLMEVLNFAHGAFMVVGAYCGWALAAYLPHAVPSALRFCIALGGAAAGAALFAALTEMLLIRRLYGRVTSQILVTVGLDLAVVALLYGIFTSNSRLIAVPAWLLGVTHAGSVALVNADLVALGAGISVLVLLGVLLSRTRYGLVIRAGAENREMVGALGIDVRRAFTVVFTFGGAAAGLAGLLYSVVFSGDLVAPGEGDTLLIFAFIVVVIGGLGSIAGSAVAALLVGLVQDYVNFYVGSHSGLAQLGNISIVVLLVLVIELRPRGLLGRRAFA
ncbi:MAG TPA: branched-chain amino acid ABC transporter permease [Acidimicrobiales bacterium]|nr:branched-chain amino acid ABC transporter permease [Acidimicrobiales bacterium]